MKTYIYSCALISALILLPAAEAAEITGKVVGVADGDTVTVLDQQNHTYKVRLAGIDAPEKWQAFGQRSKQTQSDVVFDKAVTVEWSKRDKYGRLIGKVLLQNGTDVNLRQIELGLAWHYKQYEREQPIADRHAYATAEQKARQAKLGLWADPYASPPWEFRHQKRH